CEELAADEGATNGWELAGRYASKMLPQIFRPDAPVLAVHLPPERQHRLERILADLAPESFKATDALGWVYQFWQAKRKKDVNEAGAKVGADELPAVTQLFTESYMVDFLVHNTLGAWWAAKVLAQSPTLARAAKDETELRNACRLPLQDWQYLRFRRSGERWVPAAGDYSNWPASLRDFSAIDPCCGSGHMLVALLRALVALRIETEGLSVDEAVSSVLAVNLVGIDIDPRVTEIAAFALALAAWTFPGATYRPLQTMVACSGIAPSASETEWQSVSEPGTDPRIVAALRSLRTLFAKAPVLGSLLDPAAVGTSDGGYELFESRFDEVQELLGRVLGASSNDDRDAQFVERVVAAQGIASAAAILAGRYDLVITNVPYLTHTAMGDTLSDFCATHYSDAKADLATVMQARCRRLASASGTVATVVPSTWLTYTKYFESFRKRALREWNWRIVGLLGKRAFETISGEVVDVCLHVSDGVPPSGTHEVAVVDVRDRASAPAKADALREVGPSGVAQLAALRNPGSAFDVSQQVGRVLAEHVTVYEGLSRGDTSRFDRRFWEIPPGRLGPWRLLVESPGTTGLCSGRSTVFRWDNGAGDLATHPSARVQGVDAWGRPGVIVSRTHMNCTPSYGDAFAQNCVAIVPKDSTELSAIWRFCSSAEYRSGVLALNQKLIKPTGVMDKVRFEVERWLEGDPVPEEIPASNEPSEWSFRLPQAVDAGTFQVALAILLGYRWPRFEPLDDVVGLDDDGIACIPSVRGEESLATRLLGVVSQLYPDLSQGELRRGTMDPCGEAGRGVDWWLRNKFFEQHCAVFQQRPFIWHIWDGVKTDGFAALVNYHKLDRKLLETLTYTYLGDWIRRQQDDSARNVDGASERLDAARRLQQSLELILEGEKPHDIFVRWKPLQEQPIGWEPDPDDGVCVNIRPFM
ncbi:MAG: SAM-dependent DNA methyltransferase, partial [Polyangiaceae bacterium]|nr:SAM-dependent DNA methyltransferase [Polyangiaceae bacterium]